MFVPVFFVQFIIIIIIIIIICNKAQVPGL